MSEPREVAPIVDDAHDSPPDSSEGFAAGDATLSPVTPSADGLLFDPSLHAKPIELRCGPRRGEVLSVAATSIVEAKMAADSAATSTATTPSKAWRQPPSCRVPRMSAAAPATQTYPLDIPTKHPRASDAPDAVRAGHPRVPQPPDAVLAGGASLQHLPRPCVVLLQGVTSASLLATLRTVPAYMYVLPHTGVIDGVPHKHRTRAHGESYEMSSGAPPHRAGDAGRTTTVRFPLSAALHGMLAREEVQTAGVMYHQWLALLERGLPVVKLVLATDHHAAATGVRKWRFFATLRWPDLPIDFALERRQPAVGIRHDPYCSRLAWRVQVPRGAAAAAPGAFDVQVTLAYSRDV